MLIIRVFSLYLLALLVSGCIHEEPVRQEPSYRPSYGFVKPPAKPTGGAIYQEGYSLALFADRRAARVGDIVTILLEEQTSASKSAGTKIGKESEVKVQEPTIFGTLIKGLAENAGLSSSLEGESEFSGKAESSQS
ncbi:MAG: flagellar basal body L-ring protein FlgH, partial [Gammaproteobacteria bacterium]|nr:flagellar basal body L-ring protein FlgH [Gammaproteobacteria bacterium]